MTERNLRGAILAALRDTPVVFLQGARQTGKSTLAQSIAERETGATYVTLDDDATLSAASGDPEGFIQGLAEAAGDRFHRGVILYLGEEVVPFGRTMHALPLEALWRW